ncbi:MAG: hypothetical protein GWN32_16920, partial [Gemmatimonadetes bacterium]|nr:hypothetical protein [Gemmatimonadota bacterium]
YNAGLDRPGWLIQRVNGEPVRSTDEFERALDQVERGNVVSLAGVISDGEGGLIHRIFN